MECVTETLRSTVAARPQLVIFDLDGTLTDSAQGIVSSFRHALGEVGAVVPDGDLAGRIVGPPMHHTLREMGLGEDADAAIAAYRADYTTRGWAMNRLFDGIAATARRPAGRRCAVGGGHVEGRADGAADPRALRARRALRGHRGRQRRRLPGHQVRRRRARARPTAAAARPRADGRRPRPTTSRAPPNTASTPSWSAGATDATTSQTRHAVSALAHVATIDDLREVLGV